MKQPEPRRHLLPFLFATAFIGIVTLAVFRLTDAVLAGDRARALRVLATRVTKNGELILRFGYPRTTAAGS